MKERYESYKDSGVAWIGDIPAGWEVRRLKTCLSEPLKYGANESAEYDNREWPRYIRITDIDQAGNLKEETFKSLPPQIAQEYLLKKDDILFARSGATVGKTYLFNGGFDACYAGYLIRARCNGRLLPSFLYLYTNSSIYTIWRDSVFIQATIQNISADKYYSLPIPLPPLPEQRVIACYLDARCAAIDTYVSSLEREASLARELKQAVIARAVTRGLDPNAPMRDSGIPWIEQVPQGWEVVRVKHYLKITNGCDPTTEGDVPVYGSGSTSFRTCGEYKEGPTVLLGRKGTINIPRYVEGKYWNVDTAFDVKSKGGFDLKLFYYMATCFDYESYMTQTAVPSMAQSDYNNIKIPLPPLPVQRAIAGYLDERCAAIDAYVASLEQEAALARELKQREIADAVTGKVKITA